jgi:hypothetical protein
MRHYRDRRTGAVRDLVQRPNRTVDVLPWFSSSGDVFVLARMSYPRPVLGPVEPEPCTPTQKHSSGSRWPR